MFITFYRILRYQKSNGKGINIMKKNEAELKKQVLLSLYLELKDEEKKNKTKEEFLDSELMKNNYDVLLRNYANSEYKPRFDDLLLKTQKYDLTNLKNINMNKFIRLQTILNDENINFQNLNNK